MKVERLDVGDGTDTGYEPVDVVYNAKNTPDWLKGAL